MSSVVSHVAACRGSIAQIRPLSPRDAVDLAEAYWRSYRNESAGFTLAHGTQDVARILSGAHGQLAADASLIAMIEDRAVGAVVTVIDPPYPATPAGPYIVDLYVVPTERRRGVGTALLRTALAALQGQTVHLRVDADNEPAIRLYTAYGFTPVAFARPDSSG